MEFFEIKRKPELEISLEEQRKRWMPQFFRAFSVVFALYFVSYLIRNNIDAAKPIFTKTFGLTKDQIGFIVTAYSLTYGLGKTLLGFLVDRKNSKKIMAFLVILSSLINIILGAILFTKVSKQAAIWTTFIMWGLNGIFLSPGGPCAYSTIMRWMPKSRQATWLGRWNVSHNIGGAFAGILAAKSSETFFNNELGAYFIIPGLIGVMIGAWGLFFANDDPSELGFSDAATVWGEKESAAQAKEAAEERKLGKPESKLEVFLKYVITNPWVLMLAFSNIFVYVIRMGISNWSIYYAAIVLKKPMNDSTLLKVTFEVSAMIGSLLIGWLSDKVHGRRMLIGGIMSLLTIFGILVYMRADTIAELNIAMAICGFLIFGPQLLIGVSVVKFVPLKAVAVANGITGTCAYLFGDVMANNVLIRFVNKTTSDGWKRMFVVMIICAVIGSILMFIVASAEEKRIKAEGGLGI